MYRWTTQLPIEHPSSSWWWAIHLPTTYIPANLRYYLLDLKSRSPQSPQNNTTVKIGMEYTIRQ